MRSSKHNIERLAILNAWVTSAIVILNLVTGFVVLNIKAFESLALVVFVSGTVGGAASNYRRLQEAYVKQLGKVKHEDELPGIQITDVKKMDDEPSMIASNQPNSEDSIVECLEPKSSVMEDKATILLLRLQIFLSPLFGGLFAFVLYGAFAAGVIQGEIFPSFQRTESVYRTPYEFVDETLPATNQDAAKVILWAFIAGFAEGFVPNFIDKLVKNADEEE